VAGPTVYSLPDLTTRFQRRDITATLVCAGLRRAEFLAMGPLPGELPWGPDAASTGCWSGISLAEVLRAVGVRDQACHVEFVGSDSIERQGHQFGFGGSIDMRKALADEVILATHLNGSPLPPSHGFPLRAIVPGWIGARSVKWLSRITALATPSENYFQAKAYRIQREVNPADPLDVTSGVPMAEVPLNTVILEPKADAVVPAGRVRVRGWAIGSACRPTTAIQVSAGGASDWVNAEILAAGGKWTWTFWEAVVRVPPGCHLLSARASDETGTMPARVHDTWNVKGYANNAWYRVAITAR
jgi:sulfite oxidase